MLRALEEAPYEALYGRKCRSPILWAEIGESSLIGPELVQEMTDKVVLIKEKLKAARDRQKSYVDNRRKPLEFEVGDRVMLKVSPWIVLICLGISERDRLIVVDRGTRSVPLFVMLSVTVSTWFGVVACEHHGNKIERSVLKETIGCHGVYCFIVLNFALFGLWIIVACLSIGENFCFINKDAFWILVSFIAFPCPDSLLRLPQWTRDQLHRTVMFLEV
ncbi:hypothetical protein Tco_0801567 [Tanacetum coccineum]|uniref:Reverse transcriptase domain-containing protein n=1 Tax=Tanacetum coccineum TaxID=301880 RepID=A0ABQ4ZWD9_9ASTR